jgi:hypothetical protein
MPAEISIPITIAGITFELRTALSLSELGVERWLGRFVGRSSPYPAGSPALPAASAEISWRASARPLIPPAGNPAFDPGSTWRMHHLADGRWCAAIRYSPPLGAPPESPQALLYTDDGWQQLVLEEWPDGPGWSSLLGMGAGELMLRARILFAGGLLFHASGIDDGGRSIAFVGALRRRQEHSGRPVGSRAGGQRPERRPHCGAAAADGRALAFGTPWGRHRRHCPEPQRLAARPGAPRAVAHERDHAAGGQRGLSPARGLLFPALLGPPADAGGPGCARAPGGCRSGLPPALPPGARGGAAAAQCPVNP